jgi:hypothetical protein
MFKLFVVGTDRGACVPTKFVGGRELLSWQLHVGRRAASKRRRMTPG